MTERSSPERPRLLFVCTANQHRSRTAETVFGRDSRWEVRSAGTDVLPDEPEERPITRELLDWADLVFVMEPYHEEALASRFPGHGKPVILLDIEDRYLCGDRQLVALLEERVSPHLARTGLLS